MVEQHSPDRTARKANGERSSFRAREIQNEKAGSSINIRPNGIASAMHRRKVRYKCPLADLFFLLIASVLLALISQANASEKLETE